MFDRLKELAEELAKLAEEVPEKPSCTTTPLDTGEVLDFITFYSQD